MRTGADPLDKTKMMPGRVMVTLVVLGSILGFAGIYEPFSKWAGAGATVPLLGFGNTLWKGVKEGIESDGFLGGVQRRIYGQRGRDLRGAGVWVPGGADL